MLSELLARALELSGTEQEDFLSRSCRGDVQLSAELRSLLAAHERSAGFLETPAVELAGADAAAENSDPRIGSSVGAYRIVSRLGAGGMGEVYRAVRADGQYDHAVAIKLVRFGWQSAVMLERFRRERQILATLESPGIARLYDGGTTGDGVPYVVMELVEGTRIDAYCREHGLSVRQRIALFRRVCEAVQFAHQRLVVHRDIKPSNILVTVDGTPKLLDFGIARALEETGGQQATQAALMTPAYSSPEQIRGESVTTAGDIWSLGVVLYQLLTGREPFAAASAHELAERVCHAEAPAPSTLLRESGQRARGREWRDLDNIVAKTLRKEPARRYATVQQLADDLSRWLLGGTVSATPDSMSYRLHAFVRRHRIGVAFTALAALLGAAAIAVYLQEATLAAANGRRAARRFDDVHRLATSLVFELHDAIENLPGSINARRLLADRAARYLGDLAAEATGDPALQRDLAAALVRLGNVQGDPMSASLGDTGAAERSYAKAVTLSEAVLTHAPDSVPDTLALAHALLLHADVLSMRGSILKARREAERAAMLVDKVAVGKLDDPGVLHAQYEAWRDLGGILGGNFQSGNLALQQDALGARQRALAAARKLTALDPSNREWRRKSLVAQVQLGDQLSLDGQIRAALELYRTSLTSIKEQIDAGDRSVRILENSIDLYERLVSVTIRLARQQDALTYAADGLAIARQLAGADVADVHAREDVATSLANLAEALALNGRLAEAESDAAEACRLLRAVVDADPRSNEPQVTLALALYIAGEIDWLLGHRLATLERFHEAEAIFRSARDADPNNSDAGLNLAAIRVRVGDALLAAERREEAESSYRQALAAFQAGSLLEHSEEARFGAAGAYMGLGALETSIAAGRGTTPAQARAHWTAACSWYAKGMSVWARIREPGLASPMGFHTRVPEIWSRNRGHCPAS